MDVRQASEARFRPVAQEDLMLVKQLVEEGKYRPVIDRRYDLDEIVEVLKIVKR